MAKRKAINNEYLTDLLAVIQWAAKDKKRLFEFLKDILTPAEFETIILRWQIVKMLDNKKSQREISRKLKVGVATITRGSRELRKKHGGFRSALRKFN